MIQLITRVNNIPTDSRTWLSLVRLTLGFIVACCARRASCTSNLSLARSISTEYPARSTLRDTSGKALATQPATAFCKQQVVAECGFVQEGENLESTMSGGLLGILITQCTKNGQHLCGNNDKYSEAAHVANIDKKLLDGAVLELLHFVLNLMQEQAQRRVSIL